jgi:hypothetical protein
MSTGSSDTMEMRLVQAWFDYSERAIYTLSTHLFWVAAVKSKLMLIEEDTQATIVLIDLIHRL